MTEVMKYQIPREKIRQVENLLQEKEIDTLLILTRQGSDPNLAFLVGEEAEGITAAFINRTGNHKILTDEKEKAKFQESGIFSEVEAYASDHSDIKTRLTEAFEKMGIKKLALNISRDDNLCDGLTQGLYLLLAEAIGQKRLEELEVSSEGIIQFLRTKKTETEVDYIREAVRITQEIYDWVFSQVKCGMSEQEIGDLFVAGMKNWGVVNGIGGGYDYPIVCFVRAGLAHRSPGPTKSIPGDIVIMDFSVRYKGYVSDIARTAYFLKEDETSPPKDIQHAFDTAYQAISETIDFISPGKKGWEVDQVGRKAIERGGYPTVRHSVGHQIGKECHESGTRLALQNRPYSDNPLEVSEVYAIEPTVIQDDGLPCMLVEENVVVRESGAELLSVRQEQLFLVSAN